MDPDENNRLAAEAVERILEKARQLRDIASAKFQTVPKRKQVQPDELTRINEQSSSSVAEFFRQRPILSKVAKAIVLAVALFAAGNTLRRCSKRWFS
jgi:predicted RNA-binding Zn ribbon-like protein